ncbi:hypothetical protein ABIF90_008405 [Bradyrhizobium japonicum]
MKRWAIVVFVSVGLVGGAFAHPLDPPGTVYIDGVPCNLPCQSYMAWSRQMLKARQAPAKGAANASVGKASMEAPRKRISKRVEPTSVDAQSRKKTGNWAALAAAPKPPPPPSPRSPPAWLFTTPESPPVPETGNAPPTVETSNPPKERSPQELIMAALAIAEQITNTETPNGPGNDRADETKAGDVNVSISLVALLLSRPDVKSVAALRGQNVAIDKAQSAVEQDIRSALEAVGATDAQLSVGDGALLDRLISGEVQAAVVKLVSPDAAEAFPEIKGFKVLRVPLLAR